MTVLKSWYLERNLSFLGLKAAAGSGTFEVFHNIWFWLFSESIKSPLLANLMWIRPKGILLCSSGENLGRQEVICWLKIELRLFFDSFLDGVKLRISVIHTLVVFKSCQILEHKSYILSFDKIISLCCRLHTCSITQMLCFH